MSAEERKASGDDCLELAEALRPVLGRLIMLLRRESTHLQLTTAQATVLVLLLDGPRRMSDLTSEVGVAGPSMTVLIDRMARDGWVQRTSDPLDRRAVLVDVTPAGRKAIGEVQQVRNALLATRLSTLGIDDRAAIQRAIPALYALLDRQSP